MESYRVTSHSYLCITDITERRAAQTWWSWISKYSLDLPQAQNPWRGWVVTWAEITSMCCWRTTQLKLVSSQLKGPNTNRVDLKDDHVLLYITEVRGPFQWGRKNWCSPGQLLIVPCFCFLFPPTVGEECTLHPQPGAHTRTRSGEPEASRDQALWLLPAE